METKDPNSIDTHYIKLVGKANIPEGLSIGNNYKAEIAGSITAMTEKDNEDGSRTYSYKFEPVQVSVVDDIGKTIKAKDNRSMSQSLRLYAYGIHKESPMVIHPFEELVYPKMMQKFMQMAPETMRQVVKEIEENEEIN